MARGKPLDISQVKKIIVGELHGSTHREIANSLDLHPQTVDRMTTRRLPSYQTTRCRYFDAHVYK